MDGIRKVENQIQVLKTKKEHDKAKGLPVSDQSKSGKVTCSSSESKEALLTPDDDCATDVIVIGQGVEVNFSDVAHIFEENADPKELTVFQMQIRYGQ